LPRHLLVLLVGWFCALSLGLVIGELRSGQPGFVQEQRALVSRLETEFERLREQLRQQREATSSLRAQLEWRDRVMRLWSAELVRGLLRDALVVILSEDGRAPGALLGVLEAAGARVRVWADIPAELLQVSGGVCACGWPPGGRPEAVAWLQDMARRGVRVVVLAPDAPDPGQMRRLGLSVVYGEDAPWAAVAVVRVLSGQTGAWGLRKGCDGDFPPSPD